MFPFYLMITYTPSIELHCTNATNTNCVYNSIVIVWCATYSVEHGVLSESVSAFIYFVCALYLTVCR